MRFQDWPERLAKILTESHDKPFAWGPHDCCSFAASVVKELTGQDFYAPFAGTYSTALEAARVLKGHNGVRGIATAALGDEIPPLMAGRGDVVMYESINGESLAICIGAQFAAAGTVSLVYGSMNEALTAWRVL